MLGAKTIRNLLHERFWFLDPRSDPHLLQRVELYINTCTWCVTLLQQSLPTT
jgi:hypothetical protein